MAQVQLDKFAGHQVRLFPSVHIKSEREAELRATSSLLAVIMAVSEFGRLLVHRAGGPGGRLSCFTEPPFELRVGDGIKPETIRPDGLVRSVHGKRRWVGLVEAKVGTCPLEQDQIDQYHRLAKQEQFDALITVSNQAAKADGTPPVKVNGHLLKSVPVVHYSWDRLLSEAQVLSRKKAVTDPDQKWMLDEWIRYVDDPESKIIVPPHLGRHWVDVLKAFQTGSPPASSPELQDVVRHWVGYLRKAALRLRAKLGVEVRVKVTKAEKENPLKRALSASVQNLGGPELAGCEGPR